MGNTLKALIVKKYGKQWVFANELGIDDSVVSKYVTGRKILTPEQRKIWAEKLGCKVKDLLQGSNQ